jgi:hypothetical protein
MEERGSGELTGRARGAVVTGAWHACRTGIRGAARSRRLLVCDLRRGARPPGTGEVSADLAETVSDWMSEPGGKSQWEGLATDGAGCAFVPQEHLGRRSDPSHVFVFAPDLDERVGIIALVSHDDGAGRKRGTTTRTLAPRISSCCAAATSLSGSRGSRFGSSNSAPGVERPPGWNHPAFPTSTSRSTTHQIRKWNTSRWHRGASRARISTT